MESAGAKDSLRVGHSKAEKKDSLQVGNSETEKKDGAAIEISTTDKPVRNRRMICIPPGVSSLVVRNLPKDYTQEGLIEVWPPTDSYDYLHLPRDISGTRKTTYAFVNFSSHAKAQEFTERWHGRYMPKFTAPTSISIAVAVTQGLRENMARMTVAQIKDMARHNVMPATFCFNIPLDCRLLYISLGLGTPSEVLDEDSCVEGTTNAAKILSLRSRGQPPAADLPLSEAAESLPSCPSEVDTTLGLQMAESLPSSPSEADTTLPGIQAVETPWPGPIDTDSTLSAEEFPAEDMAGEAPSADEVPVPKLSIQMLLSV